MEEDGWSMLATQKISHKLLQHKQCHIRGSEENLEFFTLIEYGANFGHEYYFLAHVLYTFLVTAFHGHVHHSSQCLLLVLIFHVLL